MELKLGFDITFPLHNMPGCNVEGTLEQCKILGASYVQKVIDSLNNCFSNLPIFTLAKLFNPKHYPLDDHDRGQLTETLLAQIVSYFQWDQELLGHCNAELLEFLETLASMCLYKDMHKAWAFCGLDPKFMRNWPILMSLW